MAGNQTKKKGSFGKVLLWILVIVFLANFDEIFDSGADNYEPSYSRPSISIDVEETGDAGGDSTDQSDDDETQQGGDTSKPSSGTSKPSGGTSKPNTNTTKPSDTILSAVPKELRSNFFLTYKEQGCCKSLTGAVHVTVVMISDSVSSWDDTSVAKLKEGLNTAAADIVSEAQGYGKNVSFSFGYHNASLTGDICSGDYSDDWQEPALKSAGLPTLAKIHSHMVSTYQVKEAPVLFVFNKNSRAYASTGGNEFLVLFNDGNFDSFQHELSHVFGAKDFYYPTEIKALAKSLLPDSVMSSGKTADPLTAYLIGWADTLADSAIQFLQNTNSITTEYMNQQGELESFTGNGTKVTDSGTYTGDMVRGIFHGTGTMKYNDGGWYTGTWKNGAWSGNGTGKWVYSDGAVYEGTFYDGQCHGTGTMTYANGSWYSGGWNMGDWSGEGSGKWKYSNGAVYEGGYYNGKCHGTGTIKYADGGWYSGGWSNDKWSGSGSGKNYYTDGSSYEGEFYNGARHGTGTYKYANGAVYSGGWANGEKHGTGTLKYADGGWYTGGWDNGNKSGTGNGKEIYSNGVYEGAFYNGQRHGQGTYTWSNGDSYSGQWTNGNRTGYGTYTWADGSSQTGTYQDGKFVG